MLVHDKSAIKGDYKLAKVESVKTSADGMVRSCEVFYRIPYGKDSIGNYSGGKLVIKTRSVQRLSLLLSVEEQSGNLVVDGNSVVENTEANK